MCCECLFSWFNLSSLVQSRPMGIGHVCCQLQVGILLSSLRDYRRLPVETLFYVFVHVSSCLWLLGPEECVVPVCDIRGVDSLNYSKGEKLFRCKLASFCRLIDLFGWANASLSYVTVCSNCWICSVEKHNAMWRWLSLAVGICFAFMYLMTYGLLV